MTIYEKLNKIQVELKAPKNQKNTFGGYFYRSCSDILEGVKPLLKKYNVSILLSDDLLPVGEDIYVIATASLLDCESGLTVDTTAMAREAMNLKGQSPSQMTGTASSYARKYALNGLFAIDDTKDADALEPTGGEQPRPPVRRNRRKIKVDETCPF
jgi:hypothetical protein